jgi:phosphoglycolate phosphatase-like HAD superfamily hydrolase
MEKCRGIIMFLAVGAVVTVAALPCSAADKKDDEKSIWTESEGRGPRLGRGRFELTDQEKDRILETLKKSDPEKAKEIAVLREKDPGRFREELRRHAPKEYSKVMRERFEKLRQERRDEFLAFLDKSVPNVAEDLAKLKDQNPDLYTKKFDLVRRKYDRAFQESRRNPELAEILLEDLKLKERSEYLVRKIKATKSERDKKRLTAQLERVLSDRYDLIVRQKIIAYERLLGWLESLQNRIKKSKAEIHEAEKKEVKTENIKQRMKTLLEGRTGFHW